MGQRRAARVSRSRPFVALSDALVSICLAPRCASCDEPLDAPSQGPVCNACWNAVVLLRPPCCSHCGDQLTSWRTPDGPATVCAVCLRRPTAVDRACSAAVYDGSIRRIVHAFKYEGRRSLARPLGRLLLARGAALLVDASCVVPVPLHPFRRVARGFNQARDLSRELPLPTLDAVWRIRSTLPQEHLTARQRRRNVNGAFALSPLIRGMTARRWLEAATVVLVDDVRTTGATLDQCARVLKEAGAREVRAITVAVARVHGASTPTGLLPEHDAIAHRERRE